MAILFLTVVPFASPRTHQAAAATPPATQQAKSTAAANPNASAAAQNILKYLYDLDARTDKRLIVGQFGAYGDGTSPATAQAQLQKIYDQSAKWPALTGMDYRNWDIKHTHNLSIPNKFLIEHWKKGSLVMVSWHANNPWTNGPATDWDKGDGKPRNVRELITAGTAVNKTWMEMLDDVASGLEQLQNAGVVVIWRPFHEMNGGWFWWHQQEQADFIALWEQMFDYFTTTKKLNNLLWAYSPNTNNNQWNRRTNFFYPGDNYVDIVGLDKYMNRGEDPIKLNDWHEYDDLVEIGRPVALLEFGPTPVDTSGWQDPPWDYTRLPRDIQKMYPKLIMFQAWEYIWQIGNQANVKQLMRDPYVITLDDLPKWNK